MLSHICFAKYIYQLNEYVISFQWQVIKHLYLTWWDILFVPKQEQINRFSMKTNGRPLIRLSYGEILFLNKL